MAKIQVEGLQADAGKMNEPIPAGRYLLEVSGIEETETKQSQPPKPMLKLKYKVQEGEYEGRIVFDNMVLPNTNMGDDANRMARSRLKALINACGISLEADDFDTQDLIGARFIGVVTIRAEKGYDPSNSVKNYLAAESQGG